MTSNPKKPVSDPGYWRYRLNWAAATGRGTFTAIYDIDPKTWQTIQNETKSLLQRYVQPGETLLDAGCGYGILSSYLPAQVNYVGVDLSPDLIEVARLAYPGTRFEQANLKQLPFGDGQFDWAICRSIRDMIIDNLGDSEWDSIQQEVLRVSKRLIVPEYGETDYQIYPIKT